MVEGLRITALSALAGFRLAAGIPEMLGKLGTAQRPDLTSTLMYVMTGECACVCEHTWCGWIDRGQEV